MILIAPLLYWTNSERWLLTGYASDLKSTSNFTARYDREYVWKASEFQSQSNYSLVENLTSFAVDTADSGEGLLNSTTIYNLGEILTSSAVVNTSHYRRGFLNSTMNDTFSAATSYAVMLKANVQVSRSDYIYRSSGGWDSAPIVLEKYKLVFFTTPKVACTVFKKLFRRMMGLKDWRTQNLTTMIPYNPKVNGLRYLYHYNLANATYFMTSPEYTRAMFVRDPKERFLSAYLDKALRNNGGYLMGSCCHNYPCLKRAQSISGFLRLVQICRDEHWAPQARRVDAKYWPYINFLGRMDHVGRDAERLLKRVGAWRKYGRSGWGRRRNESIFMTSHGVKHSTDAVDHVERYITTPELEQQIDEYYAEDYASPWLNLTKRAIFNSTESETTNANLW
jgi:hypothetical protein